MNLKRNENDINISIMEIFELRYFLAVAEVENVNKAADIIHVSTGSLSKAISRLENELQTPLFFKTGRGIRLSIFLEVFEALINLSQLFASSSIYWK